MQAAGSRSIVGCAAQSFKVPRKWLKYHKRLLQFRERLINDRAELRREAVAELPIEQFHPADAATDEFDRALALSLLSTEQDALNEIDEALHRIQEGTYGICQATGKKNSAAAA